MKMPACRWQENENACLPMAGKLKCLPTDGRKIKM
jgi:hypothetical protein